MARYLKKGYDILDGSTGLVYGEIIKTQEPTLTGDFATIMQWADEVRSLSIRTNADSPVEAKEAVQFGAEGIGLCRTEHMFFEADRIPAFRKMIVASNEEDRRKALGHILPMQKRTSRVSMRLWKADQLPLGS